MKAFLAIVIVASLAAISYFTYQLYGDQVRSLIETFGQEQVKEPEVVGPPPKTPAQLAAETDERIATLRMELIGELMNFQSSYDYRTGGWGGGAGAGSRARYSDDAPESAYWIAQTTNPKLSRARALQRDIQKLQLESAKQHARVK